VELNPQVANGRSITFGCGRDLEVISESVASLFPNSLYRQHLSQVCSFSVSPVFMQRQVLRVTWDNCTSLGITAQPSVSKCSILCVLKSTKKKKKKLVSSTKHATNSVFLFFANVDKKKPQKTMSTKNTRKGNFILKKGIPPHLRFFKYKCFFFSALGIELRTSLKCAVT
jgi:hypothetical protein